MVCSWVLTKFGKESLISCNPVAMQDAAIGKTASHHFGISSKVKDINAKQMLENIYNTEFFESRLGLGIEAPSNMEAISFEDQKILKLMHEKKRKVGEHFEMSLSLKEKSVKLPNNRNMVEKSLHCLKSRFIRN